MEHFGSDILRFFLDLILYQPCWLLIFLASPATDNHCLSEFCVYLLPHNSHQHSLVLAEFTSSGSAMTTLTNSASPREDPQGQTHLQLFQENKKNKNTLKTWFSITSFLFPFIKKMKSFINTGSWCWIRERKMNFHFGFRACLFSLASYELCLLMVTDETLILQIYFYI